MVRLIIGLGNPGAKYQRTRHNAGFMALTRLADKHGFGSPAKFGHSLCAKGRVGNQSVVLGWPQTFMNLSGQAVLELAAFYKIGGDDILVMHDEMDLSPGRLKLAFGGGAAGHNGLVSIMELLPDDFCRLKIGIGRPPKAMYVNGSADCVLAQFPSHELEAVEEALDQAAEAAAGWVLEGFVKTQGAVNRKRHEKSD